MDCLFLRQQTGGGFNSSADSVCASVHLAAEIKFPCRPQLMFYAFPSTESLQAAVGNFEPGNGPIPLPLGLPPKPLPAGRWAGRRVL